MSLTITRQTVANDTTIDRVGDAVEAAIYGLQELQIVLQDCKANGDDPRAAVTKARTGLRGILFYANADLAIIPPL